MRRKMTVYSYEDKPRKNGNENLCNNYIYWPRDSAGWLLFIYKFPGSS